MLAAYRLLLSSWPACRPHVLLCWQTWRHAGGRQLCTGGLDDCCCRADVAGPVAALTLLAHSPVSLQRTTCEKSCTCLILTSVWYACLAAHLQAASGAQASRGSACPARPSSCRHLRQQQHSAPTRCQHHQRRQQQPGSTCRQQASHWLPRA
jgi:hypothetical protein